VHIDNKSGDKIAGMGKITAAGAAAPLPVKHPGRTIYRLDIF